MIHDTSLHLFTLIGWSEAVRLWRLASGSGLARHESILRRIYDLAISWRHTLRHVVEEHEGSREDVVRLRCWRHFLLRPRHP